MDLNTADVITDFVSGVDKIQLIGMPAGNGTTYDDAGSFTTYALALAAATAAMDGNVQYFVTSITDDPTPGYDDTGLLFFDANADGTVDGVIKLTGVNDANFGASDIMAG